MSSSQEPSFSTFRFVQSSGQPENRKRIASKACESCRRRKKRCFHAPENQEDSAHGAEHGGAGGRAANDTPSGQTVTSTFESQRGEHSLSGVQRVAYQAPQTGDTATSLSVHSATSHPRFIGDLNPEVELLTATTPARQPKNNVGVWHTESADQPHPDSGLNLSSPLSLFYGSSGSIQSQLQNIAKTQCLDICPCWQDFEILEALYFENIHPILPCVDRDTYWSSPVDSPTKALLQQIICLMTCPSPSVRGLLRLPGTEGLLSPADFARKIVAAMRLSIELALVSDKAVVIQALMAMSLIAYGRESLELTPQFFIRAVQHGYTIGLHQPGDAQRNDRTAALFCSVWSMDRLHAAMQGRPVIMHEADMAKVPKEEASNQQPEFKVLISIAMLLDKVIGLYRPGASSVEISDDDFPSFEEILEECSATDSPSHLIVSLSLSAAYREYRHSKALTHRTRARKRLAQAYKHLLPSGQVFWSAAFMAEMAGKILAERHVDESEPAQESTRGPLAPQNGVQALLENESNPPNASLDSGQPLYDSGTDWNLDDLDTILEGNLDPSISWYPQDLQELFGLDLQ